MKDNSEFKIINDEKEKKNEDSNKSSTFKYKDSNNDNDEEDTEKLNKRNIFKEKIKLFFEKKLNIILDTNLIKQLWKKGPKKASYDRTWNYILSHEPKDKKHIPGAFVDWDNTPRKGVKGTVYEGVTPEKFGNYLEKLIIKTKEEYKKDYIFMFAWNEWSEGGYLEPDEKNGFAYLDKIKQALENTNELPNKI